MRLEINTTARETHYAKILPIFCHFTLAEFVEFLNKSSYEPNKRQKKEHF